MTQEPQQPQPHPFKAGRKDIRADWTKQLQSAQQVAVLMVCMGNICRSPTAHGVLEKMVADAGLSGRVHVDSAGTHGYHVGEPPDERSQAHAAKRGYDLSGQRARQLTRRDFADYDLLLVMDDNNQQAARALCPPGSEHRLHRLTDFCVTLQANEVPDPYYGGADGFEHVLDVVEDACTGVMRLLAPSR